MKPGDSSGGRTPAAAEDYAAWKDWRADRFATFSDRDSRYFAWHLARALGPALRPLQVLEVGFGNGGFLGWARAQGHAVSGVEVSEPLVARARAAGYTAHASTDELDPRARFDLIVAFDVLEHVPMAEVTPFLSGLAARLAPGGRIVLRFPNTESPFGQWYQNGDITHVTALGLSRMRQLAPRSGLRLMHWGDRLPWTHEPWSKRIPAALYNLMRRIFERFLRKMYRLDRSLDLSPNLLVVLAPASLDEDR